MFWGDLLHNDNYLMQTFNFYLPQPFILLMSKQKTSEEKRWNQTLAKLGLELKSSNLTVWCAFHEIILCHF